MAASVSALSGCGDHVQQGSAAAHVLLEHAGRFEPPVAAVTITSGTEEGCSSWTALVGKLGDDADGAPAECRRRLARGNRAGRRDLRPDPCRCRGRSSRLAAHPRNKSCCRIRRSSPRSRSRRYNPEPLGRGTCTTRLSPGGTYTSTGGSAASFPCSSTQTSSNLSRREDWSFSTRTSPVSARFGRIEFGGFGEHRKARIRTVVSDSLQVEVDVGGPFEVAERLQPASLRKVADQDHPARHSAAFLAGIGHVFDRRDRVDQGLPQIRRPPGGCQLTELRPGDRIVAGPDRASPIPGSQQAAGSDTSKENTAS